MIRKKTIYGFVKVPQTLSRPYKGKFILFKIKRTPKSGERYAKLLQKETGCDTFADIGKIEQGKYKGRKVGVVYIRESCIRRKQRKRR